MKWIVLYLAALELWPNVDEGWQHRMGGDVTVRLELPVAIEIELGMGLMRWTQHESQIPGSFLNVEAVRAWELRYRGAAFVRHEWARIGIEWARRGVDHSGLARQWGRAIVQADAPWTFGYQDPIRLRIDAGPLTVWSAPIWNPNDPLTLPYYDWLIHFDHRPWGHRATLDLRFGGPRGDDPLYDLSLSVRIDDGIWVGVAAGLVEPPSWEPPLRRLALVMTLER